MNKTQNELFKLLCEFDEICKEHDIQYILAGGCALGAVRNGGFLPWDDDVDLLIKRSEYEKLDKVLSREIRPDRVWLTEDNSPGYNNPVARYYDVNTTLIYGTMICHDIPQGHHLEIFIMDPYPSDPKDQLRFKQMLWLYTELQQPYFISANYGLPVEVTDKELYDQYTIRIQNEGLDKVIKEIKQEFTGYSEDECHLWCGRWSHSQFIFEDSWVGQTKEISFEGKLFPVGKGVFHHMRENYDSNWDMVPTKSKQITHHSIDNTDVPYSVHKEQYLALMEQSDYRDHYINRKKINISRFFETIKWQRAAAVLRNAFLNELAKKIECTISGYSQDRKKEIATILNEFLRFQFLPSYIKFKMPVHISDQLYETIMYYLIDENRYDDSIAFNELYPEKGKHDYFKEVLTDIGELKLSRYYESKDTAEKIIEKLSKDSNLKNQLETERARAWLLSKNTRRMRKGKIAKALDHYYHKEDPEICKYIGDIYYCSKHYDQAKECYDHFKNNSRNGMLRREIQELKEGGSRNE